MINVLDLFSGIGGFTLASSWVGGYRTVGFCEIEGFCRDLLKQNFPGIPIFEDVKELHPEDVIRQREPVHLITAGFPCQDISQAGVQKGIKAER
jgi:DNA (cytosine-5)-methyltransferase 1